CGMAQDVESLGTLGRDDREIGIAVDAGREIDELPVHLRRERGAREAGADRAGDLGGGYRPGKRFLRAVGETDVRHQTREASYYHDENSLEPCMNISLALALGRYDHVRELRPQGIDLTLLEIPIEEMHFRFARFREWDASEMSFGKVVATLA